MEAIRTEGLSKRFGATLALDGLSLAVPPGEVFGFLGPNGAGKSTAIRLLLGLIRPTSGRAWVFGDDAADVAAAHRNLAYVPAEVALWPRLTGAECLELLARVGGRTDLAYRRELVERFGLELDKRGGRTPPAIGRRLPWSPRSRRGRSCWCWTSRPAASTR